jgi:hypothetical protein
MGDSTSDLQSLTDRIEKLEGQNRLLKRGGLTLLLLPLVLIVMGQARPSDTLEAHSFVLRDSSGIKRAELVMLNAHPTLRFFDTHGRTRIALDGSSDSPDFGSRIWMAGEDEKSRLSLGLVGKYPFVLVNDTEGFSSQLGNTPDLVGIRTGAASLIMSGKNGKVLWSAP